MASVTFSPARLSGAAFVPPAKSEAHRALLLAAFSSRPCRLNGFQPPLCDDTQAMINGVTALGASVAFEGDSLLVTPIPRTQPVKPMAEVDVHACAAALRMLIPAFLACGQAVRFQMDAGLYKRPLDAFEPVLRKIGATMKRTEPGADGRAFVEVSGRMPSGAYAIDGSRSSQFASGMLIALAHTADLAPSTLSVQGTIVSRPYLDMTISLMERFGICVAEQEEGVFSVSASAHAAPGAVDVAGDWSQAAVFLCMNAMGSRIDVRNLHTGTDGLQGDAQVAEVLRGMRHDGHLTAARIDCRDIPDIAPILALTSSQAEGVSTLTGVSRLRIKESDRLQATQELLSRLGVQTRLSEDGDTLSVYGPAPLRGGFEADARGDHRLVMFLAAAALLADAPITVHGVECVNKSWPAFLQTYRQLGGKAE